MRRTIFAAMVCYLAAICTPVFAEGDDFSFNFTSDFYSKYVWRGQLLNDDPVFQPCITADYKGLSLCVWGNADFTDYTGNKGEFTEWDYSLEYSGKFNQDGKLGYSVGIIHYQFPSSFADTTEFYWGLSYDTFLSPSVTVYHDIDEIGGGTYVNFGLSHTVENALKLSDSIAADLVLGASLGWGNSIYNSGYWINENEEWTVDRAGLNDLAFKIALPFDLGKGWSVTPSFNYVTLVDGKLRDADTFAENSDYFFTGVSIGKDF